MDRGGRCILNIILLAAALTIIALSLAACGFFGSATRITKVEISPSFGLTLDEESGVYRAEIGYPIGVGMSWNASGSHLATWYIGREGGEMSAIEGATHKTLSYTFEAVDGKIYEIAGEADGVRSKSIKVKAEYASLHEIEINSSTDNIVNGVLQRSNSDLSPVVLSATWETRYFAPGSICDVKWLVGGETKKTETSATVSEFEFTPTLNMSDTITVSVTRSIDGVKADSGEESITVKTLDKFDPVDGIDVTLGSGAVKRGANHWFYDYSDIGNKNKITLKAVPSDAGANLSAPVTWKLRNEQGTNVLPSVGNEVSFLPWSGKNVVTAMIENFESEPIVVYALTESDYAKRKAVIEDEFIWDGVVQSHYIMDQTDLNRLVAYMFSLHKVSTDDGITNVHTVFLQPDDWGSSLPRENAVKIAMSCVDESGNTVLAHSATKFYLDKDSFFGEPLYKYDNVRVTQTPFVTHFAPEGDRISEIPSDSFDKSLSVENSNQLFRALSWGYKPEFYPDANGARLKSLYEKAKSVLRSIIAPDMTELEKTRAIYEWIVNEVAYDYAAAADDGLLIEKVNYKAYFLEGVFDDGQAVCDGKSKAFAMMCGMLGIKAVRITGLSQQDKSADIRTFSEEQLRYAEGHAWNKVFIDPENDGIRNWYVVDTTWGDLGLGNMSNTDKAEFCTMDYFLVSDKEIERTHLAESTVDPPAVGYDYYGGNTLSERAQVPLDIEAVEQLKQLLGFMTGYALARGYVSLSADVRISVAGVTDNGALHAAISACGASGFESYATLKLDRPEDNLFVIVLRF